MSWTLVTLQMISQQFARCLKDCRPQTQKHRKQCPGWKTSSDNESDMKLGLFQLVSADETNPVTLEEVIR